MKKKPHFHCMSHNCNYTGEMKTWLANHTFPLFFSIFLLCCLFVPGVIFIGWFWGKRMCPRCSKVGNNYLVNLD